MPSNQYKQFEDVARKYFPEAGKECAEFLRHKTFLINPNIIHDNGITVNRCIQYPGEFVITFCGAYHAGFNVGYNCAEAVNFACKNWINLGIKAGICRCVSDCVKIDMNCFVDSLYKKKILIRGKDSIEAKKDSIGKNMSAQNLPRSTRYSDKENSQPSTIYSNKKRARSSSRNSRTSKSPPSTKSLDNWACCDKCNKWRKLPKGKICLR